ncbi:acetyltransferase (GNAT) family protein [Orenia metallireducens]|uniref:GNAT family N-acetyltransferase n=1 Tax=Orenia metallireducens TaxID=1413210 RepID=UPI000D068483|nr:GNAT family N-acetyltransferase [Orenia metallireducens]PRX29311.1 acetyltransferase (GNAT) family protein [Orenia metallireducens]
MKLRFEMLNKKHVKVAADLVMAAYQEENKLVPYLPMENNYFNIFEEKIKDLFVNGSGVVAISGNKVVGFLAGYEIEQLWGKCKGIYTPLYGNGAIYKNRRKIYQELYKHTSDLWVKNNYTQHAITLYAQDKETIDTWFWLGFGLRCVDAIREVSSIKKINRNISIKKVEENDISSLANVQNDLHMYFRNSPMFMPAQKEDPIQYLKEWLSKDNHHLWIAYDSEQKKALGLMKIEPSGERFITEHPKMRNITGVYVDKKYRQKKIGVSLLGAIQEWLLENDYKLCGVDYESFNILGSNFWNKYFTPYTYSLVRRIDERILEL